MEDWDNIQKWLKNLGSQYEQYIPIFEDNGFDEWEIINDLTLSELSSLNIKLGHAKKIHKHRYDNRKAVKETESPETYPVTPINIKKTSDATLFSKLMSKKNKNKSQYMKHLEENKFIHKKPHYLHRKCRDAYYTPRKSTKKLLRKNKLHNIHVLNINDEADVNSPHWDSTRVSMEAEFRTDIQQCEDKIDESLKEIDFSRNVSAIYSVPKDKNTQRKVNTKAKDIIKDKQTLLNACTELTNLVNKTEYNMKNTLKIIDEHGKAVTCM